MIPVANPHAAYAARRAEINGAVQTVLNSGRYILGEQVEAFERKFAAWSGAAHCVGCANGTDAIALALHAFGIGGGHAVAVPSFTAVPTVAAIRMVGATPLLLDVEHDHWTLDPVELAEVLDRPPADLPPIRAVIAVHLYGQPCDLEAIQSICRWRGAALIEDCAQAHGAALGGRKVGLWGDAAAWSFYPTKNLGALGDAGAVTTSNARIADAVQRARQYGWDKDRIATGGGWNSRLDEIQAAVLRVKLRWLDAAVGRRQEIAARYDVALHPQLRPKVRGEHARHLYVLRHTTDMDLPTPTQFRTAWRGALVDFLAGAGVGSAIHYDRAAHQHPAFARCPRGPRDCRVSTDLASSVLTVPLWPEMDDADVDRVCEALSEL